MGNKRYVRQRWLTICEQRYLLGVKFPGFRVLTSRNDLHCIGGLQPSPTSDVYTIEIRYTVPLRPEVRVLHPELRLAPGASKLKHVFPDGNLCLYISPEWRADLPISHIVEWTSLWLYIYEFWVISGEWLGGGHEPNGDK
jgi:hypothetical protein